MSSNSSRAAFQTDQRLFQYGSTSQSTSILIVDDNRDSAEILKSALEPEGYAVQLVLNAEMAVSQAEAILPDVIFLDVMMPKTDGYAICRAMRESEVLRDSTIILVTALTDSVSRRRGFAAGADDFLSKPVELALLRLRVRTIAKLGRFRRALQMRSRLADLAQMSPTGIVSVDRRGIVLDNNPAAGAMLGDVAGASLRSLIAGRGGRGLAAAWRRMLALPQDTVHLELRLKAKSGREFPAELSLRRASDHSAPVQAIVTVEDASQRIAAREQAAQRDRFEAVARMTAGIAHDFSNYLTSIGAAGELMSLHGLPPEDMKSMGEQIFQQVCQAKKLVERLQAFTKGKATVSSGRLDLNRTIRDSAWMLRSMASAFEVDFALADRPVPIAANEVDVRQILSNLVANACDAMQPGGRIQIASAIDQDACLLRVSDEGCGMSADIAAHIFEPYFTTKEGTGGTGLGLANVYNIVTRTRGTIDVKSTPGRGTALTIRWPLRAPRRHVTATTQRRSAS